MKKQADFIKYDGGSELCDVCPANYEDFRAGRKGIAGWVTSSGKPGEVDTTSGVHFLCDKCYKKYIVNLVQFGNKEDKK